MNAAGSLIRLLLVSLLVVVAGAAAAPPASAAPFAGFKVTGDVTLEHTSLTVEGEITVARGGTLTLDSVDLVIVPSATAAAALVVEPGGTLIVRSSTVAARSADAADAIRVDLQGASQIRDTTFRGLAADATRPVGPALSTGLRLAPGGVLIASDDVLLERVRIEQSAGCAVTVFAASPTLRDLDATGVSYRLADGEGFAGGVCVDGGSPTIEGLRVADIGSQAEGAPSALFSAAVVANTPVRLTLRDLDAQRFAPALEGLPAPTSTAVFIQDPAFVEIRGGRIEGAGDGIVLRGTSAPPSGGSVVISQLAIVNTASGPVSVVAPYTSDPGLVWSFLDITGCGGHGLYFESQNSGVNTAVTATVDNVTARNCGGVGINLFDNVALGAHNFNVWTSNASSNGQEGFYLHGSVMGAGLNVQMSGNGAWLNNYAGIRVDASYASGGAAKIASAKLEYNTADNNTRATPFFEAGGVYLQLGAPATMSLRYLNNTARGNGVTGASYWHYGHYIEVRVTNGLILGTGWMTGIVAMNNSQVGVGLIGGAGIVSRFDTARIRESIISGQPTGIYGENARIEIWDSIMGNPDEFQGLLTGFYAMGVQHMRLEGTTTGTFKITSYKFICMNGRWQNGAALYLLPLTFLAGTNNSQASVFGDVSVDPPTAAPTRQTDANGNWSGWVLDWVFDPQLPAAQQYVDYAPLTIVVQLYETSARSPQYDLTTNICGTIQFTDPNPPTLVVSSPRENGTYTRANLTVQGTVTDDLSGVAGLEVSVGGTNWVTLPGPFGSFTHTFVNLTDATYDLFIRSWDRASAGLDPRPEALVVLYTIRIDTLPPTIGLTDPSVPDGGVLWTSNSQILFRGNLDSEVAQLFINGQPINITGTAFIFLGDLPNEGPQTFLFLAIDFAGNARNLTVTVYKDTVAPTLIVTAPTGRGEIFVASHDLLVTGITDANAVVSINGVAASQANGAFSALVTLAEGRNLVNLSAVDAAGNRASRTLTVTADTVAPSITVTSHTDGAYLNDSRLALEGFLSEPVSFLEINQRIFEVSGTSFTAVLGLSESPNRISINATDRAGNVGQFVLRVTVDLHAPDVTLFGLLDFSVRNTRQLSVHGSVSEVASVEVNGVAVDLNNFEFDASLQLSEGLNTITITATDLAGNTATVIRLVTLDTQDPTVEVLDPEPGATVNSRTVRIVGNAEPNATVWVGNQLVLADAAGHFSAWVSLDNEGANAVLITVTDGAGNSVSRTYTVTYAAPVTDTSGDLYTGIAAMAAIAAGLAVGGRFLAKRRVDGEVEGALASQQASAAAIQSTPGYTEPYAPPAYYPQQEPYAPPPAPYPPSDAPGGAPPRPPRPPRPPSD